VAAVDTEDPLKTGRFQEAKFNWPLSGIQFLKATVALVPQGKAYLSGKRLFRNV
jgi:hypothetical protein